MRVPSLPPPHLNDPRDHLGPKAKKTVTMLNLLSAAALPRPGVSPIPNFALPVSRGPPWQPAPPGEDARRVVTGGWAPRAWTPLATGGGEGRPQGPPPRGKRPPSPGPSLLATPAVPDARPAPATTPPAPASGVPAPPASGSGARRAAGLGGRQPAALSPRRCLLGRTRTPSRRAGSGRPRSPAVRDPHPPPARPQAAGRAGHTSDTHRRRPRRRRRRLRPS